MDSDHSDDDYDTGLPKCPEVSHMTKIDLNLGAMRETGITSFNFEAPLVDPSAGEKAKPKVDRRSKRRSDRVKLPHAYLFPQSSLLDKEDDDVLKVMFLDFSDIEKLMTNLDDEGKIKKKILRPGTGKKIEDKQMVVAHYKLGAEVMDELIEDTYEARRPRRFRVGTGEVLPVMDIGVLSMRVGEIAKFLACSEYGFGETGVPLSDTKVIPRDVRIMLEVEVVDAYQFVDKSDSISGMSPKERDELPFSDLFQYADEVKKEGNREFKAGNYNRASKFYLETLDAIIYMKPSTPEEAARYLELRQQTCNNIAHAYCKQEKFKKALKYAKDAADLPVQKIQKAKSHYWCAKALFGLGKYTESLAHIKQASSQRTDNEITALKQKITMKVKENEEKERELCSRMMMAAKITSEKAMKP